MTPIQPRTIDGYHLLHEGVQAFANAENNGFKVDVDYVARKQKHLKRQIAHLKKTIFKHDEVKKWKGVYKTKMNLDSNDQFADILFNHCGHKPKVLTEKGNPSVGQEALEQIDSPVVEDIIKLRRWQKAQETYLGNYVKETVDELLHPFFHLHTVRTFRSCLAGGTKIRVVGKQEPIPIQKIKEGDCVYCFDDELKPSVQKVLWSGKTGHREIIRVHWKTNHGKHGYLDCTPEHKIRATSGKYIRADHLLDSDLRGPHDNVRSPKHRVLACGRNQDMLLFTHGPKDGIKEHRLIFEQLHRPFKGGEIVHHKDWDHWNNCPDNLQAVTKAEHAKIHNSGRVVSEESKIKQIATKAKNKDAGLHMDTSGSNHPNYISIKRKLVWEALLANKGVFKDAAKELGISWPTISRICERYGFDKKIKRRFGSDGTFLSKQRVADAYKRNPKYAHKELKTGYYTFKWLLKFYKIIPTNNHTIYRIEKLNKKVNVYDIEVEKYHNFIANEICVHNSSSRINFQNQPTRIPEIKKMVRSAVIPRLGHVLVEADYSGVEVRMAAVYHKDKRMIQDITDPTKDMHRDMAKACYLLDNDEWTKNTRYCAKNKFVFPQFYGDYYKNCAANLWMAIHVMKLETSQGVPLKKHLAKHGIRNYDAFEKHIQETEDYFWNDRYTTYRDWKEDHYAKYLENGYVDLKTGFRCSGLMSKNDAINYPIQGSAFHCLLWAFIQLNGYCETELNKTKMIGQIHDASNADVHMLEFNQYMDTAFDIMENKVRLHWPWINVPLDVEAEVTSLDGSWYTKAEVQRHKCECGSNWMWQQKEYWECPICSARQDI